MAYVRGRFGVEYHPHGTSETHRLRWLMGLVALLVLATFTWYQFSHRKSQPVQPPPAPPIQLPTPSVHVEPPAKQTVTATMASTAKPPPKSPEARLVEKWLETAQTRPDKERVLLERLAEAERQQNIPVAIDTIRKLYDRPTMADLQDPLVRRLGDLNLKHLLSGAATPWTTVVTAKRGDSRDRIAREHRTTPAAVSKLNPKIKWERLRPGDTVRVLDFPNAVLVIYKQRGYADLSLKNGQIFRRYYLAIAKTAKNAVYPIASESGATVHGRFRELGIRMAPGDRAEIEMFLAPGSRITVAE